MKNNFKYIEIMNRLELKTALFKLDTLLKSLDIDYVITGTLALDILGAPIDYMPNDIDVQVWDLSDSQKAELQRLHDLAGITTNETYDSMCFSFLINGIKVNIIVVQSTLPTYGVPVQFNDLHIINVQEIRYALADKMKLHRPKDIKYRDTILTNILSL